MQKLSFLDFAIQKLGFSGLAKHFSDNKTRVSQFELPLNINTNLFLESGRYFFLFIKYLIISNIALKSEIFYRISFDEFSVYLHKKVLFKHDLFLV